jgi:mRNA-degrading endonuclease RelE of RelBE toxin-antitoxin system
VTVRFTLNIPADVERRLDRCRASIRRAIRDRLRDIAVAAAQEASRPRRTKSPRAGEPTLRFYVYEGYRVLYRLDPETRRVVVSDLAAAPP